MRKLTEDMFLSAEGIRTSSEGVALRFAGRKRTVSDGPTTESKELIGGFCMPRGEIEGRGRPQAHSRPATVLRDAKMLGDAWINIRTL
jgi:hypothetical protein